MISRQQARKDIAFFVFAPYPGHVKDLISALQSTLVKRTVKRDTVEQRCPALRYV